MSRTAKRHALYRKKRIAALLFVLPPLLGWLAFTCAAAFATGAYSFMDFRGLGGETAFIGLQNYTDLFTHPLLGKSFVNAVWNTLILLIGVPLGMIAGLVVAHFLNSKLKGGAAYRILLYLPAVSSGVALNIVWRYIFNNEYGVAGFVFGHTKYWLSDPVLVKAAITVKNVWAGLGGTMLLYLAGMQNIASVYYEAAEIDGANGWRKFFSVTLPMLTPVTFYLAIVGLIGGLQSYADSQVFAAGVPEAQTVVFFIWQRGISNARYGIASAASVLLALVIMLATAAQFKLSNRWVFEE
jgi:multiple sugar transport system permease protein